MAGSPKESTSPYYWNTDLTQSHLICKKKKKKKKKSLVTVQAFWGFWTLCVKSAHQSVTSASEQLGVNIRTPLTACWRSVWHWPDTKVLLTLKNFLLCSKIPYFFKWKFISSSFSTEAAAWSVTTLSLGKEILLLQPIVERWKLKLKVSLLATCCCKSTLKRYQTAYDIIF